MRMDSKTAFTGKAENYARYRWDYAAGAVEAIFEIAELSKDSVVADIAAGTGILTRHFAGRVEKVFAIEPNPDMRAVATRDLASFPSVSLIDGSAEATTLSANSVDLISVAQAIHWFEPEAAGKEMRRILKPTGILAIVKNIVVADQQSGALEEMINKELGPGHTAVYPATRKLPVEYYYGGEYQKLTFSIRSRLNWQQFFGLLSTISYMPAEDDPRLVKLKDAARSYFARYSQDGILSSDGVTELLIGRPA